MLFFCFRLLVWFNQNYIFIELHGGPEIRLNNILFLVFPVSGRVFYVTWKKKKNVYSNMDSLYILPVRWWICLLPLTLRASRTFFIRANHLIQYQHSCQHNETSMRPFKTAGGQVTDSLCVTERARDSHGRRTQEIELKRATAGCFSFLFICCFFCFRYHYARIENKKMGTTIIIE